MSVVTSSVQRQNKVWVFNGGATFAGNPKWLFIHVVRARPDIEAWWICDDADTVARVRELGMNAAKFGTAKANAVQRRAGVYVVNQVKEHIAVNLEGAHLLNLWHGVGVKNIERGMTEGYLAEPIAKKYIRYNSVYRSSQQFLVTSPAMERHFRSEVGLDDHNVIRGPYPQNVVPQLGERFVSFDHNIRARAGAPADARLAVYAPTPRRTGSDTFLARALPDMPALIAELEKNNTLLVLKMHPHMTKDRAFAAMKSAYGDSPYLYFWENDDDIYEIFGDVDLAVVDYSSILYDLLAAGVKNVIRYAFDLKDEDNTVLQEGMNYLELSAGTLASDFQGLLEALAQENKVAAEDLARLDDHFWAYSRTTTVDDIIEAALEFEPQPVALPTLYTYDVFDTVIGRDFIEPFGVFEALRDRAQERGLDLPRSVRDRFVEVRRTAESVCRENRRKRPEYAQSQAFEITLETIYDKIQEVYGVSDASRQALEAWEQELEIEHVRPLPERINEVLGLLDAGEDVRFISDMYLPESTVRAMLVAAEPRFADVPFYLSSTVGVQKSTKQLYLHVYRDTRYDYERWIHTGDNPHADHRMPSQLGITTVRVKTPRFDDYERQMISTVSGADGYRLAALLFHHRQGAELAYEDMFAFRHVALWLVPYVDWVLSDAITRGYKTLYFISRDGHHMKRIADVLIEERGLSIKVEYIFGSRLSWRYASMLSEVPPEVFGPFGSFAGAHTLGAIAAASRLGETELVNLVPALEGFSDGTLGKREHKAVMGALQESTAFASHLLKIGAADRALLQEYMMAHVDFSEPHAFVEYWGRGYTQDCLVNVLKDALGDHVVVPFYYARSIYSSDGAAVRHDFTTAGYSMLGVEAVFANLPHGTVERFERDAAGVVVPVTSPRQYDRPIYDAVERALPAFARAFARASFGDLDTVRREAFRFGLEHFTKYSSNRVYAEHIGRLHDSVELGGSERAFAPALKWADFVRMATGTPRVRITRNLSMSLAQSGPLQKKAYGIVKRYKLGKKARLVRTFGQRGLKAIQRKLGR